MSTRWRQPPTGQSWNLGFLVSVSNSEQKAETTCPHTWPKLGPRFLKSVSLADQKAEINPQPIKVGPVFLDSVSNSEQEVEKTSPYGKSWNLGFLDSIANSEQKVETPHQLKLELRFYGLSIKF